MRKILIIFSFFLLLALILALPLRAVTSEPSPVLTEVVTPGLTLTEEVLITPTVETVVIEQVTSTPTPALLIQPQEGIQFKELIAIAIVCFLALIIILQVYLGGEKEENIP